MTGVQNENDPRRRHCLQRFGQRIIRDRQVGQAVGEGCRVLWDEPEAAVKPLGVTVEVEDQEIGVATWRRLGAWLRHEGLEDCRASGHTWGGHGLGREERRARRRRENLGFDPRAWVRLSYSCRNCVDEVLCISGREIEPERRRSIFVDSDAQDPDDRTTLYWSEGSAPLDTQALPRPSNSAVVEGESGDGLGHADVGARNRQFDDLTKTSGRVERAILAQQSARQPEPRGIHGPAGH